MSDEDITTIVSKRGEVIIQTALRRTMKGVRLAVKVHPTIEELLRRWGQDSHESVLVYGRHWVPTRGEDALRVWLIGSTDTEHSYNGGSYSLEGVGQPLVSRDSVLNLSFLRLVGASEGAGMSFFLSDVYSTEELKSLNGKIAKASRQFYVEYLMPVEMSVTVSTDEVRL